MISLSANQPGFQYPTPFHRARSLDCGWREPFCNSLPAMVKKPDEFHATRIVFATKNYAILLVECTVFLRFRKCRQVEHNGLGIMTAVAAKFCKGIAAITGVSETGITRPETTPPPSLPAAPLKSSGRADMPYPRVWASQASHFLSDHSIQYERMAAISKTNAIIVNNAEFADLFMASGWKASPH